MRDSYQKPLSVYKRDREADTIVDCCLKHQVNYLDFLRDEFSEKQEKKFN